MYKLELHGKRGQGKFAMVDDADFEILAAFKWYLAGDGYAQALLYAKMVKGKHYRKQILMHRLILLPPQGIDVDHRDTNKLNNQRDNLRVATSSQNQHNTAKPKTNTSGYKGVHWHKAASKWRAQIRFNSRNHHLGYFPTAELVAQAYDTAALEYFGEFARTNTL